MPRAIKNLDIALGLAIIPVQLFTATSSTGVAFHWLHAKCGSRIQIRLECPIHGPVPREETVKGFETSKDEYVRFEPEELKALEQVSSSALVIDSFVPERAVDPVYFEDTYYLGAGKTGGCGYQLLRQALEKTKTGCRRHVFVPREDHSRRHQSSPDRAPAPAALLRGRGTRADGHRPRRRPKDPRPGAHAGGTADQ